MRKNSKVTSVLAKIFVPAFALLTLSNCSEDEILPQPQQAVEKTTTAAASSDEPVLSLTIDGIFTELVSTKDCKTCHFIVPANATTVDGKALGIKPGQAICLDAAIKYGNLSFVNLEGTESSPILIAYGVNTIKRAPVEDSTGE